jgi:hypothetical protein
MVYKEPKVGMASNLHRIIDLFESNEINREDLMNGLVNTFESHDDWTLEYARLDNETRRYFVEWLDGPQWNLVTGGTFVQLSPSPVSERSEAERKRDFLALAGQIRRTIEAESAN